jgi:hypothetical protein
LNDQPRVRCAISVSQDFQLVTLDIHYLRLLLEIHDVLRVTMAYLSQFEMSHRGQQWKDLGHRTNWCHAINHAPWSSMVHDSIRPGQVRLAVLRIRKLGLASPS